MQYIRVNLLIFTLLLRITSVNAQKKQVFNLNETQLIKDSFIGLDDNILDSNDSLNQLKALYRLAEDKSFVSIGEATHGTEEIKKFQIILSKGLILNSKFQTIALAETHLLATYAIFDYVVNNNGNLDTLYNKYHFEISNLMRWLNNYNSNKPFKQRIYLIGTDIDSPENIIDFVDVHCKFYKLENSSTPIDNLRGVFDKNNTHIFANNDILISNKDRLISILNTTKGASDSLDFKIDCMVRSLNSLPDILKNTNNSLANFQNRDYLIFKNLEWLNNLKGKTVIINAHNLHINKITITPEIYTKSSKPFGKYLAEKYNQDYLSIATEVDKGFFYNGSSPKTEIIEDKKKFGTILGSIVSSNYGYLVFNQELKNILNSYNLKITKGTSMSYIVDCYKNLGDAFDALIFIKSSNPYTFNNKEEFCNLFFNLDDNLFSNILSNGRLTLASNYETDNNKSNSTIIYSIFLNDVNKKAIIHYRTSIKESGQEVIFNVPQQTKYISINITSRNHEYLRLKQFKINNQPQKLDKFTFYDWNNLGYNFKIENHDIVITKPRIDK